MQVNGDGFSILAAGKREKNLIALRLDCPIAEFKNLTPPIQPCCFLFDSKAQARAPITFTILFYFGSLKNSHFTSLMKKCLWSHLLPQISFLNFFQALISSRHGCFRALLFFW
jgi:hypothetical protein